MIVVFKDFKASLRKKRRLTEGAQYFSFFLKNASCAVCKESCIPGGNLLFA
jgi:hypothetical protein